MSSSSSCGNIHSELRFIKCSFSLLLSWENHPGEFISPYMLWSAAHCDMYALLDMSTLRFYITYLRLKHDSKFILQQEHKYKMTYYRKNAQICQHSVMSSETVPLCSSQEMCWVIIVSEGLLYRGNYPLLPMWGAVTLLLIPAAFIAAVTRREEINATATSTITTTTALLLLTQHDIG